MVHPALQPFVDDSRANPSPHPSTLSIEARRDNFRQLAQSRRGVPEAVDAVRDGEIVLAGRTLRTRLYVPLNEEGRAVVVYFHGGSFVMGDLETHDALCRRLCADTRMRFVAIEYRLAPEHPFPSAVDDAIDAVRYVRAHLDQFSDGEAELIVMGDSSGGCLAAVAAAITRGEGLGIAAQVIIYPTLGPEVLTDSAHTFASGFMLELEHLRYDYTQYLNGWRDHTDPRVTPLFFEDLSGAPPAIVVVAECDPLRDEGVAYAGLLEHCGVPVELLEARGMVHGFLRLGTLVPDALEILDEVANHMHRFVEFAAS
ncbi:MAG: alpha/beta hydrolase [Acidimicrobiales bacterium]